MSNSNPPPPPQLALSSLPDDIVLRCLVRVPRMYHLNISWVSKHLRALVRSPELNLLRSTLHVCFEKDNGDNDGNENASFHWFTLNPTFDGLVLNPNPFPSHPNYGSSTVAVGSKIFSIGGSRSPSSDLWILDTRSGNMTQGPPMSVPREGRRAVVEVIDGKIYVMGGGEYNKEIQVEVFDLKSETWELAGVETVRKFPQGQCSASVEGKVYMVEYGETSVYDPREPRMVRMTNQRLSEGGVKDKFTGLAYSVCVVDDVLFAFFYRSRWILWFDTNLNVWKKLVGRDGKELSISRVKGMSEYDGRLLVFSYIIPEGWKDFDEVDQFTKNVQCMLVSLDRAGEKICGTIDWSGIVGTVSYWFNFQHCLAVSE